jgi:hypothetical protein
VRSQARSSKLPISHLLVCLTVPMLCFHVLHLCSNMNKVPITLSTVLVFSAIRIVLPKALGACKVDIANPTDPVAARVFYVLLVSPIVGERSFAAIAVGHDTAEDCVVLVGRLDAAHHKHILYNTTPHKSLGAGIGSPRRLSCELVRGAERVRYLCQCADLDVESRAMPRAPWVTRAAPELNRQH